MDCLIHLICLEARALKFPKPTSPMVSFLVLLGVIHRLPSSELAPPLPSSPSCSTLPNLCLPPQRLETLCDKVGLTPLTHRDVSRGTKQKVHEDRVERAVQAKHGRQSRQQRICQAWR